ncbi:hypothetical protein [Zavarzinia sp. CC-PAN008]|uniref:hypothetical protein n=1 Tax=Zavarzinia sp. CC-PAN008 TaxID=3243332 RepID=UPI003F746AC6
MERELAEVGRKLNVIPEGKFVEIVRLLERIRTQPAVQRMLDDARPRLVHLRPARRPTLQRLFCLPFEDLLINRRDPDADAGDGRITRVAMSHCWMWLAAVETSSLDPLTHALASVDADDLEGQEAIARVVWVIAARSLSNTLADRDDRDRQALLGPHEVHLEDISQICRVLRVAEPVQALRRVMPMPVKVLEDDLLHLLHKAIVTHGEGDVDRIYALLIVAMAHMAAPGALMERLAQMDLGLSKERRLELLRLLGMGMMNGLEAMSREAARSPATDLAPRAYALRDFTQAVAAAEAALKSGGLNPRQSARLGHLRREATRHVDTLLDQAKAQIGQALVPGRAMDVATMKETEASVRALTGCASFAAQLGREKVVQQALNGVVARAEEEIRVVLGDLLAGDRTREAKAAAERRIFRAVRLVEQALGPKEAEDIRVEALAQVARMF